MTVAPEFFTDQAARMLEENRVKAERRLELRRASEEESRREERERQERSQAASAAVRAFLRDRSPENRQAALSVMERVGQGESDLARLVATYDEVQAAERVNTPRAIAALEREAEKAKQNFEAAEEAYLRPERRLQAARQAMFTALQAASDAGKARRQAGAQRLKFPELFTDDEAADDE